MRTRTRERTRDQATSRQNEDDGRRKSSGKGGGKNKPRGGTGGKRSDQGGANRAGSKSGGRRRSPRGNRRNRRPQREHDNATFWGDATELPAIGTDVRITDDPAAVPRSLGPPPLPGHESIAEHYFTAIYDRAVTTAGALAAAGGLIDPDALTNAPEG